MPKVVLNDVASLTNENSALSTINQNYQTIETAFDNTLSRDGTTPNQMGADLDMNSNKILNLPEPSSALEPLRLQDLSDFIGNGTINIRNGDFVNILDYGAVADGDVANATLNYNALVDALAMNRTVFFPYTSAGYNFGSYTITMDNGQQLIGERNVKLISTVTEANCFIRAYSGNGNPRIENFTISMPTAGASSTAIRFANSLGVILHWRLNNLIFESCVEALGDEGDETNYIHDLHVKDARFVTPRGRQIFLSLTNGHIVFEDINGSLGTDFTSEFARFENVIGLDLVRFTVQAGQNGTYNSDQTALVIVGHPDWQSSCWLERVLVDSTAGNGISITDINYLMCDWLESFQNLGYQILLDGLSKSQLTNVFSYGANGLTGASESKNGLSLVDCADVQITNALSFGSTGTGIIESGTSDRNTILGSSDTNVTANVTLSGDNSAFYGVEGGNRINKVGSGGTVKAYSGATTNYNVISLNQSLALNGSLGMFGGASGDNAALYLSSPGTVRAYIGGSDRMIIDSPVSAAQTSLHLYDVDNGAVERVTVGAADSGGTGFKVLRIPN